MTAAEVPGRTIANSRDFRRRDRALPAFPDIDVAVFADVSKARRQCAPSRSGRRAPRLPRADVPRLPRAPMSRASRAPASTTKTYPSMS
jgi:hypothetical protein